MKNKIYKTISGMVYDLSKLSQSESDYLSTVLDLYQKNPDWTEFSSEWNSLFDESGLSSFSPSYRISQDLEARLGIDQGKVSPPDYRDYLMSLIELRHGSGYNFYKGTGIDLGRILTDDQNVSNKVLKEIIKSLQGVVIIIPEEEQLRPISPKVAIEALSYIKTRKR